jgi:hypothetical protein
MVKAFLQCKNRKQQRKFTKDLSKAERKFLDGQARHREMMKELQSLVDDPNE